MCILVIKEHGNSGNWMNARNGVMKLVVPWIGRNVCPSVPVNKDGLKFGEKFKQA